MSLVSVIIIWISLSKVPNETEREELAQVVKHKWRLIGLQLGVETECLDVIEQEYPFDEAKCCSQLFRKWANGKLSTDCPFVWKEVIKLLHGSVVREVALASELEKKIN